MSQVFLLVDDHPMFRKGLQQIISMLYPESTVHQASNIKETLEILSDCRVDLVILDVNLPDGNGIRFLKDNPEVVRKNRIVLMTMYTDRLLIKEAVMLGVSAYLSKESAPEEIELCLKTILSGKKYLNSQAIDSITSQDTDARRLNTHLENLTKTERAVLNGVIESLSSKEIAKKLGVSYRTIENHRYNICSKLGLKGVNALTRFVLENKQTLG
ncbi:MAG: response regulator transcription factor [Balneolales bacterium]|nr:response regulator transcription factor [Balneolales bacterium]